MFCAWGVSVEERPGREVILGRELTESFNQRQEIVKRLVQEAFKDVPQPTVEQVCIGPEGEALMYQQRLAGRSRDEASLWHCGGFFEFYWNDTTLLYYLPILLLYDDPRTGQMGVYPELMFLADWGLQELPGDPWEVVFTPEQLNAIALYVKSYALLGEENNITRNESRLAYESLWHRFVLTPDAFS